MASRIIVTDEQFGQLHRRLYEVARRVNEGTIPFGPTMGALQAIVENKLGTPNILHIDRTTSFDPKKFLDKDWSIVEEDERSLALTEVDFSKVKLKHMLKEGETSITGEEKLKRLKEAGHIRLDAKIFQTLWENKESIPEAWKEKTNGKTTYIYFDGTVLRSPSGSRGVFYLYWRDGRWYWGDSWLENDWNVDDSSAVLASQELSS